MKFARLLFLPCFLIQAVYGNTPTKVIPYKVVEVSESGSEALQLHVFEPAGHSAGDRRPAVVFFFGGGWFRGHPQHFYAQSAYLASRGMVAISAQYRTEKSHGVTPDVCVTDAKSAMRWVRAHAEELGIDPEQILAGGGSAGGHLAAATAFVEAFDDPNDDLAVRARPEALLLFNPVLDNGPGGYGHDRVADYWESFSPLHNIREGAPPTAFFLGTEDELIPVSVGEDFKSRLEAVGERCDLFLYEGQGHGFFNRGSKSHKQTLAEMDAFLVSLGYLAPK